MVYSYDLSLGGLTNPGPGLWPFLIGLVIVLCSVVLLTTEHDSSDYERFSARSRFTGIGFLSLGVFVLLFARVGFVIPSLLTMVFWLRILGEESWRTTLMISVICTVGFYVLFVPVLGVPFPEDLLVSLVRS